MRENDISSSKAYSYYTQARVGGGGWMVRGGGWMVRGEGLDGEGAGW